MPRFSHPITNSQVFGVPDKSCSEVVIYKLSPEELAKYREGDKKMPAKIPPPPKEEILALIVEHKGHINAMAQARKVSWQTMEGWITHYELMPEIKAEREAAKMNQSPPNQPNHQELKSTIGPAPQSMTIVRALALKAELEDDIDCIKKILDCVNEGAEITPRVIDLLQNESGRYMDKLEKLNKALDSTVINLQERGVWVGVH